MTSLTTRSASHRGGRLTTLCPCRPNGGLAIQGISRPKGGLLLLMLMTTLGAGSLSCNRARKSQKAARSSEGSTSREDRSGLTADRQGAGAAGARLSPEARHGAPPLKVLGGAILTINEKYVAPSLVDPMAMFDKALEYVEAERVEVRFTGDARSRQVLAQVGDTKRRFALEPIKSLSVLYTELKRVLGFVRETLQTQDKPLQTKGETREKEWAEIEYAAVNGIVSTLDPHSVLMPPRIYDEMRIRTQGAFGGIGIVISIRDGALTVISPIDGTPAARAGIRAGDRIVKIEDESTVNMPLNDAVERLRGKPGSLVAFSVEREGWPEPRELKIVREKIEIKSVDSKMLRAKIGYLRVNRFSHNTTEEIKEHLEILRKGDARGIILDMWNNPGGLLQQAEKVADLFLSSGDIVITEAAKGEVLRVRRASAETTRWSRPLVVLINRGSASAAEIVAGALKQQGRAPVLGERTFGKGTVQMLFENDDSSALKLTVAQYLTPGNISIQGVGVVPDVMTNPVVLRKEWTRMFGHETDERRRAKRKDLLPARSQTEERPLHQMDYLSPESKEDDSDDLRGVAENAADGPVIELARQLLDRHGGPREEMLRASKSFLSDFDASKLRQIVATLRGRGVDWTAPPAHAEPLPISQVELTATFSPKQSVQAGEKVLLRLSVTNRGERAIYRLRGRTDAPTFFLDEREILVGRVAPGETRNLELKITVPNPTRSSIQPARILLESPSLTGPLITRVRLGVRELPRPRFRLSYRLHDDVKGNGDGRPEVGETVRLRMNVQNVGKGPMTGGVMALRNLSGHGVFVLTGRKSVKNLVPGATVAEDLTFRIEPNFKEKVIKLELSVYDSKVQEGISEHVFIPVAPATATAPGLVGEISPPEIRLKPVPLEMPPGVRTVEIQGEATDKTAIRDLFVEVSNYQAEQIRQKAFYKAAPRGQVTTILPFKARVPLWPGLNTILVVAREKGEVMGFKRFVVYSP